MKFIFRLLRKIYKRINSPSRREFNLPGTIKDAELASDIIYNALISDEPVMIARFGSTELSCLANYLSIKNEKKKYWKYIQGESAGWWWDEKVLNQMQIWSGFFPPTIVQIEKFCELMLKDIPEMNVIGSWLKLELLFSDSFQNTHKLYFELLNPFFAQRPWSVALEGKNVLVIHPFAKTIEMQYLKRELLFKNNVLPSFSLKTIKAVQTVAGNTSEFDTWFDALDHMKNEIDKVEFDICLIGCGAYGFPLAAHVKRKGKKAIHLGGSLQLLFGIKGKRWEDPNYNATYNYATLMNEYWVRPSEEETPNNANKVEGGSTYW
jgi:hypothetical protein